jgi:23S rRNA pseudouridine955/2504/2580 synthase
MLTEAIVYEDADLLVLNKPAGVAVHGGSGLSHGVIEVLRAARPGAQELDLVHRLDRDTSGCLIVAKRRAALRDLHAQLREGRAEKRYLALVCGKWDLGQKRIDAPLATGERRGGERHVAVRGHGQVAVSTFRPVQFFGTVATLMEVQIGTGKTHQIRVHAAHAGHPVAGDDKYGDRERNEVLRSYGLNRMFLHAASIGVDRPGTHEPLSVSAPLGADLHAVLEALLKAPGSRRGARRR